MRLTRESLGKARKFGVGPVPLIISYNPLCFSTGIYWGLLYSCNPFYRFLWAIGKTKLTNAVKTCQDRDLAIPGAILGELHMLCARETRENQCSLSAGQLE